MDNYYIKDDSEIIVKNYNKKDLKKELIENLKSAILELEVAHENYNLATDDLVDYYIYKIKAAKAKYDYLIRMIKNLDMKKTS